MNIPFTDYPLRDVIPFSRDALFGLYENYNRGIFPTQFFLFICSLCCLFTLFKNKNLILVYLYAGAANFFIASVYFNYYLRDFTVAAPFLSSIFVLEGALLFVFAARTPPSFTEEHWRRHIGLLLFTLSTFIPIECLLGAPTGSAMLFGWSPLMTAIGSLGLGLTLDAKYSAALLPLPAVWIALEILMHVHFR